MCMYDLDNSYYIVDVYEKNILDIWWKSTTLDFANKESAIKYAKKKIEDGKQAKVYKTCEVVGWK